MSISAVLWDLGGIVYVTPYEVMDELEVEHGLPTGCLPRGPFTPGGDPEFLAVDDGTLPEPQYWAAKHAALAAQGIDLIVTRDIDWHGRERLEVVALMDEIVASPLAQGALTNDSTTFLGAGWSESWWLRDRFAAITDSVDIGVRKPDPRAYQLGCAALGAEPSTTIFVDDLHINCDAARAAGLQAFYFDVTRPRESTDALRALLFGGSRDPHHA